MHDSVSAEHFLQGRSLQWMQFWVQYSYLVIFWVPAHWSILIIRLQGYGSHGFKKVTVTPDQQELWHCSSLQNIAALQHWVSRMQKIPLLSVSTEGASKGEGEWDLFITTFKGTKSPGRVKNIFLSPVPAKSFPFQFCLSLAFTLGLCWQSQIVAVQIICPIHIKICTQWEAGLSQLASTGKAVIQHIPAASWYLIWYWKCLKSTFGSGRNSLSVGP